MLKALGVLLRAENDLYAGIEERDLEIRAFLADPVEKTAKIIGPITPYIGGVTGYGTTVPDSAVYVPDPKAVSQPLFTRIHKGILLGSQPFRQKGAGYERVQPVIHIVDGRDKAPAAQVMDGLVPVTSCHP